MVHLSIIIVNYNTYNLTTQCIESIYNETQTIDFEIIIVDNASNECSPKLFVEKFPRITLIENRNNEGFGRANNQGMSVAKGAYILLLNSDTIIIESAIDKCYGFLKNYSDQDIGVIGCRQIDEYKNELITHNNKSKFSFWKEIFYSFPLFAKSYDKRDIDQQNNTKYVSKIAGSFILLKRIVFEQTKGFDPNFFLYYEEMEWFSRISKKFKIIFFAEAKIIHKVGASSNKNDALELQKLISKGLYYKKMGISNYIIYLISFYINSVSYLFLHLLKGRNYEFKQTINLILKAQKYFLIVIPTYSSMYGTKDKMLTAL